MKFIGLRTATKQEIAELKAKYPLGKHKTHTKDGKKLPFNGVFVC